MTEARIEINGRLLSEAQAMTVRTALTDLSFRMQHEDALGDDEHGRRMVLAYRELATEVLRMMIEQQGQWP